jgi:hypothetical protein
MYPVLAVVAILTPYCGYVLFLKTDIWHSPFYSLSPKGDRLLRSSKAVLKQWVDFLAIGVLGRPTAVGESQHLRVAYRQLGEYCG